MEGRKLLDAWVGSLRVARFLAASVLLAPFAVAGCMSPYHADRGALAGGLVGAGTGALVGNAVGNTGAGAAIGAGVGALTGGLIGNGLDEVEARNRAMIAQQMGRAVPAGVVSTEDVVAMSRAGVADELIVNHIRANGMARPPQAGDLIVLQQEGVSTRVIAAMQEPPAARPSGVIVEQPPPPMPVIVEEYDYGPAWGPPCYWRPRPWPHHPRPGVSWGVTVAN